MGATAASAKAVKQKRKKSLKHRSLPLEKSHLGKICCLQNSRSGDGEVRLEGADGTCSSTGIQQKHFYRTFTQLFLKFASTAMKPWRGVSSTLVSTQRYR